jgi:hypothetical protein
VIPTSIDRAPRTPFSAARVPAYLFFFFSLRRVRGFEKEIHRFNRAKERIGLEGGKGEGFNAANFSASQVLCRLSLQLALFLPVPNDF